MIAKLLGQGYKKWEIGNYWGLQVLPRNGIDLSFDASLYMMNTQAVQEAKSAGAGRVTLALEDTPFNWQNVALSAALPGRFGCLSGCAVVYQCGLYPEQ